MTRHAFERDESGAWGASRHETDMPAQGVNLCDGKFALRFRSGSVVMRACRTPVLARMLALTVLA